jgi:hypothetical protein
MNLDDLIECTEKQLKFLQEQLRLLKEAKELQEKLPALQDYQRQHLELMLRAPMKPEESKPEPLPEISNRGKWTYGPDRSTKI